MSKQYGLILNTKTKQTQLQKTNVFKDEDDENFSDNDNNKEYDHRKVIANNLRKEQFMNSFKIAEELSKNIIDDPSIYEYDNVVNDNSTKMQRERNIRIQELEIEKNKPKYFDSIMKSRDERKLLQEISLEKAEQRKREAEGVDDKPKYITKK